MSLEPKKQDVPIDSAERPASDQEARLDAAIAEWNAFDEAHGSFADEHAIDLLLRRAWD